MATIWEETKIQTAKMKGKSPKEKLAYFWEYYRVATIIIVASAALIFAIVHAMVTSKDYALSVMIINSIADDLYPSPDSQSTLTDEWRDDLSSLIEFDPKKYEVAIDASMSLGMSNTSGNEEYANSQKLAAMMSAKTIDLMVANTQLFEQYAQNGYFYDLRLYYSDAELEEYASKALLFYTDAGAFDDYDSGDFDVTDKQASYNIDHHDPSSMTDPIPCGFFVSDGTRIGDAGIYSYLTDKDIYQGHKQEGVIGIPCNTPRIEAAKTAIEYFLK